MKNRKGSLPDKILETIKLEEDEVMTEDRVQDIGSRRSCIKVEPELENLYYL